MGTGILDYTASLDPQNEVMGDFSPYVDPTSQMSIYHPILQ